MNRSGLRSCILESQIYIRATTIFHGITRLHPRNEQAPVRGVTVVGRNFPLQLPGQPNRAQVFQRVRQAHAGRNIANAARTGRLPETTVFVIFVFLESGFDTAWIYFEVRGICRPTLMRAIAR